MIRTSHRQHPAYAPSVFLARETVRFDTEILQSFAKGAAGRANLRAAGWKEEVPTTLPPAGSTLFSSVSRLPVYRISPSP